MLLLLTLLLLSLRLLLRLLVLLLLLLWLLLLWWWLLWFLGLWLLRGLRRLAGVGVAAAKAQVYLGGRGIWHPLIIGTLSLCFCFGRIPQRRSLRHRRKVQLRWAASRTVGSGRRWRCRRIWRGRG